MKVAFNQRSFPKNNCSKNELNSNLNKYFLKHVLNKSKNNKMTETFVHILFS